MKISSPLIRAVFIRRLNRFEVECLLEGRVTRAYLPNPGRLWEILLPGKEIYLREGASGGKHAFTVWAA
ncbi:MAG: DNA/RNA nuclease SfsA, partial [Thermodesulforhabdaceae bacterium]